MSEIVTNILQITSANDWFVGDAWEDPSEFKRVACFALVEVHDTIETHLKPANRVIPLLSSYMEWPHEIMGVDVEKLSLSICHIAEIREHHGPEVIVTG